jgi:hypothetical protein
MIATTRPQGKCHSHTKFSIFNHILMSGKEITIYLSDNDYENVQSLLVGLTFGLKFVTGSGSIDAPAFPVVHRCGTIIFGANNVSRYLAQEFSKPNLLSNAIDEILDVEEFQIRSNLNLLLSQKISWSG